MLYLTSILRFGLHGKIGCIGLLIHPNMAACDRNYSEFSDVFYGVSK